MNLMAEDEGFEPPQTESESGVLPLHKSSISGTGLLYPIFWKSQAEKYIFSDNLENLLFGYMQSMNSAIRQDAYTSAMDSEDSA